VRYVGDKGKKGEFAYKEREAEKNLKGTSKAGDGRNVDWWDEGGRAWEKGKMGWGRKGEKVFFFKGQDVGKERGEGRGRKDFSLGGGVAGKN